MKAIVLAAWYWTRMLPITKTIPKELLPIGTKPVIHYIIEWLVKSGIKDILIVTSQHKKALEDYFDKNYELEETLIKKWKTQALEAINQPKLMANFTFVKQKEQLWTWHAIMQARPRIQDDFFMVVYGDEIHHPKIYQEMIDLHNQSGQAVMFWKQVSPEDISKYGILDIQDNQIVDIVEKPPVHAAPSEYALFSPFIWPRRVLDLLTKTKPDKNTWEIYPRDAVKDVMQTEWVMPYISNYPMRDASGSPESWLQTNIEFAQNPDILK